MSVTEGDINIDSIDGCGLGRVPDLKRDGDEIICKSWQEIVRGSVVGGEAALDDVNETRGTAICKYSLCNHLSGERV